MERESECERERVLKQELARGRREGGCTRIVCLVVAGWVWVLWLVPFGFANSAAYL